jgi:hypothetical protein
VAAAQALFYGLKPAERLHLKKKKLPERTEPILFVIVVLALVALRFKIDILWVVLVGSALSILLL